MHVSAGVRGQDGLRKGHDASKIRTGMNKVKVRPMLIRIGPDCDFVRGDSEYGTPNAI